MLAAGDFDNDGDADLAVGVPHEKIGTAGSAGYINIFEGSPSGLSATSGYSGLTLEGGSEAGSEIGAALAAGDLNGDGYDDLAIGSPQTFGSGRVFVQLGTGGGVVTGTTMLLDVSDVAAPTAFDGVGDFASLAMGDVDGDGDLDLGIGIPGQTTRGELAAGAVMVADVL